MLIISLCIKLKLHFFYVLSELTSAHARKCEAKSAQYKGICMKDSANCATICQGEGFSGGECSGWKRDCVPSPARKTCRIACARIKVLSYEMDHASKVHMILTVFF
jgi:hypothetical protein